MTAAAPACRLEAVRRVDWLVLAGARPRSAAYVGADEAVALGLDALGVRCDRLLPSSLDDAPASGYDLVALQEPSAATLASAVRLVAPGGWIYVEARGALGRRRPRRPRAGRPAACRALLRRAGLETSTVCVWPDFARCRELVRADDATGLREAFGRRERLAWALAVVGVAARMGVVGRAAPCVAVLARRPEGATSA